MGSVQRRGATRATAATRLTILVSAFTFIIGCMAQTGAMAGPGQDDRYAAIVIDARSRTVMRADDADAPRYPASLTKMMTLYLTFEALAEGRLRLTQRLPVSAHAQSMSPTKLGLRQGQTLMVEHAVMGLVTKSANDAAVVLAEAMGGTEDGFARMMTAKARSLGMRNTVFRNASGLPDSGQVTTARDMARLGLALVEDHPKYYQYFSRREFVWGGSRMANHNRLMRRYPGMDGIKTGYIGASGFNLTASAVRDGRRLVAVVMGGRTARSRDDHMAALLDEAFAKLGLGVPPAGPRLAGATPPVPPQKPDDEPATAATPTAAVAVALAAPSATPTPDRKPTGPQAPVSRQTVVSHGDPIGQLAAAMVTPARPPEREENWGVQVGAFTSQKASRQALTVASRKASKWLADGEGRVETSRTKKGPVYRARFVGLDEDDARAACVALKRAGQRCVALPPRDRS